MICSRNGCENRTPTSRRSNAKYCSDKCYKAAKRVRDRIDYSKRKLLYAIIKNNDDTLGIFHRLGQLVPISFLKSYDFNFESWIEAEYIEGEKVYSMFDFAYSIRNLNGNKWVKIWDTISI